MSQQQQSSFCDESAGSMSDHNSFYHNIYAQQEELEVATLPARRRECTNFYFDKLYAATLVQQPGAKNAIRTGGRRNKNEILGLTLARLLKEKYLNGITYSRNMELSCGIPTNVNNGEFILVLRTDGRIVAISDEAEHHFGKSMRSLYTQFINIFECLNKTDGDKLRSILNSSNEFAHQDHQLVCTFRLPKGKRPSRANEDVKTISMVGHLYSCDDSPTGEKLFIARCEALVSQKTKGSSSSQTAMMIHNDNVKSMIKITLNGDMSINTVSSNVKEILGYTNNEMSGNWIGRYIPENDLEKFEKIQQKFFQHEEQQQQQPKPLPMNVCEILDIYTNYGDGRLTFSCQIRLKRQRRSKLIEFEIVAQPVDPSLRDDYVKYIQSESKPSPISNEAQQVNFVPSSISEASKDSIMAHSPSLAMGLLIFDNGKSNDFTQQQQCSTFSRQLSNVVAPVNFNDEFWEQLFNVDYNPDPAPANFQYWPTDSFNDTFISCQSDFELASYFEEYLGGH
ncbi:unnamed protein product [Rotaria sp. Silwood2]|nr:unnamed protein product [Rotaria sp. Silwood2]CAF2658637.1 unnamed protein product [Rotaria sp. Silwood2]CAF2873826.1 unnamed protein product [Rotaria sp. Silwood2]CAF3066655.1 unnamed protein product [Rotaria sp. Silwood2]CAF4003901.1 unnamed protein product [Rotaria sp. Silwood2]